MIVRLALATSLVVTVPAQLAGQAVELVTPLGTIVVELYPEQAPQTVANFLRYVDEGRLAGATFYRAVTLANQPNDSVRIEVIQGGLGRSRDRALPPIPHESTDITGLRHVDGTLSMARSAPGSASSEIFITLGPQPELDYGGKRNPDGQGFAAFGRVVSGMEVVKAIHSQEADGQMLVDPVAITVVRRASDAPARQ